MFDAVRLLYIPTSYRHLIKLFCFLHSRTREIKPNQTDIGRKITKKITPTNVRTMSSVSQPNGNSNSSSSLQKRSLEVVDRNSSDGNNALSHLTSHQQIPTINSHSSYSSQDHHHDLLSSSSYHLHQSSHHHNNALNGVVHDDIDQPRSMSSNLMGHNLNRNSGQQNHRNPDIMRRPIK